MGCGCGGSKRQGQQQGAELAAKRRDGGSVQVTPRQQGGFTWNGPARETVAPKSA